MIRSEIVGGKRIYKPNRRPVVFNYDTKPYNLDPELRKLKHVMMTPTPQNREYAFWNDSVSQSFAYITASTITGDGLRIRCNDTRAKELIEDYLVQININRKSIEDYITRTWIDELVHGGSYWYITYNKDYPTNLDIQRLDPKTLTKLRDKHYAWTMYIQKVPRYKAYRSEKQFYRNAKESDYLQRKYSTQKVYIPDKPERLLRTNFFIRPPISSALHYITYKRWITYFMRKYSQKHWAPFIVALVGDPKTNYYPQGNVEMEKALEDVQGIIPNITNFGGVAMPGNVDLKTLDSGTAKSSEIYTNYLNAMDKQIMMSMFASMGLREASGVEKSTQTILREGYLQYLKGIRRKYEIALELFFIKALCPANGIKISNADIDIDWSPLKIEGSLDLMKSIQIGSQIGMFETRNELRKAGQTIYNWLDPLNQDERIDFEVAQSRGVSMKEVGINTSATKNPNIRV